LTSFGAARGEARRAVVTVTCQQCAEVFTGLASRQFCDECRRERRRTRTRVRSAVQRARDPEWRRKYDEAYRERHRQRVREAARKYSRTPKGKAASLRQQERLKQQRAKRREQPVWEACARCEAPRLKPFGTRSLYCATCRSEVRREIQSRSDARMTEEQRAQRKAYILAWWRSPRGMAVSAESKRKYRRSELCQQTTQAYRAKAIVNEVRYIYRQWSGGIEPPPWLLEWMVTKRLVGIMLREREGAAGGQG
jgi:hypothetical protein